MENLGPQELYDRYIAGEPHVAKRKGLEIVHAICKERFEAKATSWTVASIGRLSEERGGPTAASMRQPKLEHYRALIKAWESASRSAHPHERRKRSNSDDWIEQIDDLTSRQLVYMLRRDLEIAQAENRRLKRLLPDGGVLKVTETRAVHAQAGIDPTPNQVRSTRRFVQQFFDRPEFLREKGLILKNDALLDSDTGEIIADKSALDAIRLIADRSA